MTSRSETTTETAPLPDDETTSRLEYTEDARLLAVRERSSAPPYRVEFSVNGHPLSMEVDTGAAVSVAPESAITALLQTTNLEPTSVVLRTYTGEQIPVRGVLSVSVGYGGKTYPHLKLLSGPCLIGRDWLRVIRLDWRNIAKVTAEPPKSSNPVAALLDRYREVFSESLGTITPFHVKLSVTPDAKPKFFKPRSVPYAIREKVAGELDRLDQAGVLEKVSYSEWAAPIVAVPKRDGGVRLCGDYKVTVNPVLDIDQYPLPKPEDIFATLAGGQQFSTLDLQSAAARRGISQVCNNQYPTGIVSVHTTPLRYSIGPCGIPTHNGHDTTRCPWGRVLHRRHYRNGQDIG